MEVLNLKKSNCKNCYKCIRHCPVKAIRFSGNQAHIVSNECILCGNCFVVCPQNAKEIVDDTEKVRVLIQSGAPVVASIAPSFVANYDGVGIQSMQKALTELGFTQVEETAIGATIVKNRYDEILNTENRNIIISSCCHSVNLLIQKHFPKSLPYLADVVSPMQAHALDVKRRIPNAKVVFIGPCVAKKHEAQEYGDIVDAVLTFEELSAMLDQKNIKLEKKMNSCEKSKARLFPTTGGILKTMAKDNPDYDYIAIDGVENCIAALNDIEQGKLSKCFIEMSACVGSCIDGPIIEKHHRSPIRDYIKVARYAGKKDFDVQPLPLLDTIKQMPHIPKDQIIPSEEELKKILAQMGKTEKKDELDCGSCGYNSCREKAIAIYNGKATYTMCLPFLKDKAESFSDNIISNTPNGIFVLNENLEVQQINRAALKIINISRSSDILGEPVVRILEPKIFMDVLRTGKSVRDRRIFLAEYQKYVEMTVVMDKDYRLIICIMRDVTEDEKAKSQKDELAKQTVEVADKVINNQMRIVQEIASLLGETAAETKIALIKLKGAIE